MRKLFCLLLCCLFWQLSTVCAAPAPVITAHFQLSYTDQAEMPYYELSGTAAYRIQLTKVKQEKSYKRSVELQILDQTGKSEFTTEISGNGTDFYFLTSRTDTAVPDLAYVFLDGTGAFLNDFRIIGQVNGQFQELFTYGDLPEEARIVLGSYCRVGQVPGKSGYAVMLSGGSGWAKLRWDGSRYCCEKWGSHQR